MEKKPKKSNKINYLIDENNVKVSEADKIADSINTFFTNVGTNLANNIMPPQNSNLILPDINPHSMYLNFTDETEVKKTIDNLKIKNGSVDGIHVKVLITLIEHIEQPLTQIINNSILTLVCLTSLKKAEVIPIYKRFLKK